jgi:DnaJ-class molecular chaperone
LDFYNLLGVSLTASDAEIKHSFREMAKKYHPDLNNETDAGDNFRMLYIAYETLTDPFKRKIYDRLLENDFEIPLNRRNWAWYEKMQRRANLRARQYSEMQYHDFEDSAFSKAEFHTKQAVAFFLFFSMMCAGMGCFLIGSQYIFNENFNGAQLTGLALWLAGCLLSYISGKALLGIYEIWRS